MQPTRSTTAAEWKVIRWFFGCAFLLAFVYLAWTWQARRSECTQACQAKGFKRGALEFNAGSRINIGTRCECAS